MADMINGLKSVNAELNTTEKSIGRISSAVTRLLSPLEKAIKGIVGLSRNAGKLNIGQGNRIGLGTDGANFAATTAGGNSMATSLASSEVQRANRSQTSQPRMSASQYRQALLQADLRQAKFGMAGGIAQMAMAPFAGAYSALPDLGTVTAMASGFYGAAAGTNVRYGALQKATFGAITGGTKLGVTSATDMAAASAMLTQGYNMYAGGQSYMQTMREVGGAARFLNMNNATAAQALGQYQTGAYGAQLYQYGIAQFDKNMNPRSQGAIAKDIYKYIFGNQRMSAEDMSKQLQYGTAGASLREMAGSPENYAILQKQFLLMAQGKNPDLTAQTGAGNPAAPGQQIATSEASLAIDAQKAMTKGFQQAADAVSKLNKNMEGLPDAVFQFKGALQGFLSSNVGKGSAVGIGTFLHGAGTFATNYLAFRGVQSVLAARGVGAAGAAANAGKTAVGAASKGAGFMKASSLAALIFGGARTARNAITDPTGSKFQAELQAQHTGQGGWRQTLSDTFKSILHDPFGAAGGGSSGFGASFGAKGGGTVLRSPIPGVASTTNYGAKDASMWKGASNKHTGQDYPVPIGTPVQSVTDGIVIDENLGKDYGIYVQINGSDGLQYIYAHLSSKSVQNGSAVTAGQVIGKSGDTGNVTGPHLHFEVRKGKNNPIDPKTVLGKKNALGPGSSTPSASQSYDNPSSSTKTGGYYANAQGIYDYLKSQGLSSAGAKGVLGNLVSESGLRTGAIGDSGTSYGLAQWHAGRWQNLNKFSKASNLDPSSVEAQQAFLVHELKGYKSLWRSLSDPNIDAGTAAAMFMRQFERPADQSNAAAARRAGNIPDVKGGGASGFGASMPDSGGGAGIVNNFSIQVQVQSASEEEAVKFAKRVQSLIEEKSYNYIAGSK